jgi:hypothetical protein
MKPIPDWEDIAVWEWVFMQTESSGTTVSLRRFCPPDNRQGCAAFGANTHPALPTGSTKYLGCISAPR